MKKTECSETSYLVTSYGGDGPDRQPLANRHRRMADAMADARSRLQSDHVRVIGPVCPPIDLAEMWVRGGTSVAVRAVHHAVYGAVGSRGGQVVVTGLSLEILEEAEEEEVKERDMTAKQPGSPDDAAGLPGQCGIRAAASELARVIHQHCPDGRERDTADARIEEAVMWSVAALASRE